MIFSRAARVSISGAVVLGAWLIALPCAAQADAAQAQAQSLFEQARSLMAEGRYAEACPKLEESQRLDPGGGTLLNLASCHEKLGRTATAWAEYKEALGLARRDGRQERIEEASARIAEIEPQLSRLRIVVSPANPDDLKIAMNEAPVGQVLWGTSVPVDPGRYAVRAEAPGHVPFESAIVVEPRGHVAEIVIPVLDRAPSWEMSASPLPTPIAIAPNPQPAEAPRSGPVLGWTMVGVGVVGLGVGTYFGLRALDKKEQSDAICDQTECPREKSEAVDLHDEAVTSAWISNVALGVGIVGVGVGTFLVLSHDDVAPRSPVGVAVGARGGSVHWSGSW